MTTLSSMKSVAMRILKGSELLSRAPRIDPRGTTICRMSNATDFCHLPFMRNLPFFPVLVSCGVSRGKGNKVLFISLAPPLAQGSADSKDCAGIKTVAHASAVASVALVSWKKPAAEVISTLPGL